MAIPTSIADLTWLGPGEPAGAPFARGASAGASIANAWQNRRQVDMQAADRAELQRVRQAEEARKAKEAAIQFAGFQDYQTAVASGMKPDEAIKQFGAAMFYKSATFPNFVSAQERSQIASERASETAKYHTDLLKQRDDISTRLGGEFDRKLGENTRQFDARIKLGEEKLGENTRQFDARIKLGEEKLGAETTRANKAEEGRNERAKAANEAAMERELLKLQNRVDKNGRIVSKSEFVSRHLTTLINNGIAKDEKEAAKRLGDLYDEGAIAAPKAMGGYKIGTVYRGLRYLGGDPKDRSSWVEAVGNFTPR